MSPERHCPLVRVERGPSLRRIADVLAEGTALGLYARTDIVDWALEVIEREHEPPIAVIDLATSSRLDDSETAELLHGVPGIPGDEDVRAAVVGILAKGVAAGRLDERSVARDLYMLCLDAPGELGELATFEDRFFLAEDGYGSTGEVAAGLRAALRPFEELASGFPLPGRWRT
jgi:hypothetical protein